MAWELLTYIIAGVIAGAVWAAIVVIVVVKGVRWLARRGTRHHDLGPRRALRRRPRR